MSFHHDEPVSVSGHTDTIRNFIHDDSRCVPADIPEFAAQDEADSALDALEAELVGQADRIAWLEGDVAQRRIENQRLRDALAALVGWFEENDRRADDWGELWVVKDARAVLDGTPSEDA